MIPSPGVGILMISSCSAARSQTEKYMNTAPPPPGGDGTLQLKGALEVGYSSSQRLHILTFADLFRRRRTMSVGSGCDKNETNCRMSFHSRHQVRKVPEGTVRSL